MSKIQEIDYSVDLLKAILWQYNDAAKLQSILEQKQSWYTENQEKFWTDWFNNVFNLQTADDFGLTVWSIILDIPIVVVEEPPEPVLAPWGVGQYNNNFENGNFAGSSISAQALSIEQARTVLRMRYFQITSRGTVPEINRFLNVLFEDQAPPPYNTMPILDPDTAQEIVDPDTGLAILTPPDTSVAVLVQDNNNMTAQYVFFAPIPAKLQFIFENYDILPRPAGVQVTYIYS